MNYYGFDLNTEVTPKPWGYREKICWQDAIRTLVLDTVDAGKKITGHKHFRLYSDSGGEETIYCDSNKRSIFRGYIGLNTVPSSDWYPGVNSVIDMYGSSEICSISNYANHCDIMVNSVQTAAAEWKYRADSFATKYMQTAGGHAFYTAPLGLKDDIISFNLGLTIDSNNIVMSRKVGIKCTPSASWDSLVNSVLEFNNTSGYNSISSYGSGTCGYLTIAVGCYQEDPSPVSGFVYNQTTGKPSRLLIDSAHWRFQCAAATGAIDGAITWKTQLEMINGVTIFNYSSMDGAFSVYGQTTGDLFKVNFTTGSEYIYYTAPTPNFYITNTTASAAEGSRASRIYGKGYTVGGGTPVLHALGYHEFSHPLGEMEDQTGQWILYLNDGNDGDSPSVNVLKALFTSMNFYVDTWLSKSAPIFYIENITPGNADGDRACVINARGMRTATLAELGRMVFSHNGTGTDFAGKWQLNLRDAALGDVNIITVAVASGVTIYDNVGNLGLTINADAASSSTGNAKITFINDTSHSGGVMMARSGLTATLADALTLFADDVHDINIKTNNVLQQKVGGDGKIYMYNLSDLSGSANKKTMVCDTVTKEIGWSS